MRRQIHQLKEQKKVMVSAIRKRQSLFYTEDCENVSKPMDYSASLDGLKAQKLFEHRQKAMDAWDDPALVISLSSDTCPHIIVKHDNRENIQFSVLTAGESPGSLCLTPGQPPAEKAKSSDGSSSILGSTFGTPRLNRTSSALSMSSGKVAANIDSRISRSKSMLSGWFKGDSSNSAQTGSGRAADKPAISGTAANEEDETQENEQTEYMSFTQVGIEIHACPPIPSPLSHILSRHSPANRGVLPGTQPREDGYCSSYSSEMGGARGAVYATTES
jgi:hypothetical protein